MIESSLHDEHRSSGPRPVKLVWTSKFFSFDLELYKNKFKNLIRTSKFFSFYLELYKDKFKNLIGTSKFKFSFWGLWKWHRLWLSWAIFWESNFWFDDILNVMTIQTCVNLTSDQWCSCIISAHFLAVVYDDWLINQCYLL